MINEPQMNPVLMQSAIFEREKLDDIIFQIQNIFTWYSSCSRRSNFDASQTRGNKIQNIG